MISTFHTHVHLHFISHLKVTSPERKVLKSNKGDFKIHKVLKSNKVDFKVHFTQTKDISFATAELGMYLLITD